MRSLTVTVPMTPHRYLNPNSGKHARTKRPYYTALRDAAALAAADLLRGRTMVFDGPVRVVLDIYWPAGYQTLDFDNACASCKGLVDGVFHHLDADDRQMIGMDITQQRDPAKHGFVTVTVTAASEEKQTA